MGNGKTCAKVWLISLNTVLVVCSVLFVVIGGIVGFGFEWLTEQLAKTDFLSYEDIIDFLPSAQLKALMLSSVAPNLGIGMLIIGSVTLVVSLMGCFGACKESKCLLVTYAVAVSILLLAQLAMVIAFWAMQDKFLGTLKPELQKSLDRYTKGKKTDEKFWDTAHQVLGCCGVNGVSDFQITPPVSCCVNSDCVPPDSQFSKGCLDQLKGTLESSETVVIASSASVLVVQLLVIIAAIVVNRGREKVSPEEDS